MSGGGRDALAAEQERHAPVADPLGEPRPAAELRPLLPEVVRHLKEAAGQLLPLDAMAQPHLERSRSDRAAKAGGPEGQA